MTETAPATTAAKAVTGALLRHFVTTAGTALVAHGYLDQQTADGATGPIADYLLGAGLVIGSAAWGAIRARVAHWRWVRAWVDPARALAGGEPSPARATPQSGV